MDEHLDAWPVCLFQEGEKVSAQDTLLATMLDDPQVAPARQEIIVEGNKERFRYILDW